MKRILLSGAAVMALPGMALANCPAITQTDMQGIAASEFPQQYELAAFEEASRQTRFAKGEGLPGKAWAEARPVVLKAFDGSYFKRTVSTPCFPSSSRDTSAT